MQALQEAEDPRPSRRFRDVLSVPVPHYAKPLPTNKQRPHGKWQHAVVYGDTHRPFHDPHAEAVVFGVIKDVRPQLVAHLGDLLDCYTISRFSTDPMRLDGLQGEIDAGREHLWQVSHLAPDADKLLLGGNHEDRLRKLVWDLRGAHRELPKLRIFQRMMTWPVLLDLVNIGWDYVDYTKQPVVGRLSKLLLKHGDVVRKWSAWTEKAEWEKHARSGISGHSHRMGAFYHRDLNGSHVWKGAGCTCSLEPEYVRQPDWQQGCLVVAYSEDRFQVEEVYIERGRALWRGREFAA